MNWGGFGAAVAWLLSMWQRWANKAGAAPGGSGDEGPCAGWLGCLLSLETAGKNKREKKERGEKKRKNEKKKKRSLVNFKNKL